MIGRPHFASALLLLAGCASVPRSLGPAATLMTIDFVRHQVVTANWHAELVDCSTSDVQCLAVPSRFIMSFPRSCDRAAAGWIAAGTRFRETAPMAHFGPPSGGYFSDAYPHIHLAYQLGFGFITLWRTARTPDDPEWNTVEDRVEQYRIGYVGMPEAFACH